MAGTHQRDGTHTSSRETHTHSRESQKHPKRGLKHSKGTLKHSRGTYTYLESRRHILKGRTHILGGCCFQTLIRHQIAEIRDPNFQTNFLFKNLRGDACQPKKHLTKGTKSGEKNRFSGQMDGMISKQNIPVNCTHTHFSSKNICGLWNQDSIQMNQFPLLAN